MTNEIDMLIINIHILNKSFDDFLSWYISQYGIVGIFLFFNIFSYLFPSDKNIHFQLFQMPLRTLLSSYPKYLLFSIIDDSLQSLNKLIIFPFKQLFHLKKML